MSEGSVKVMLANTGELMREEGSAEYGTEFCIPREWTELNVTNSIVKSQDNDR